MSVIERALEKYRRQNERPGPNSSAPAPTQAVAAGAPVESPPAADVRRLPHRPDVLTLQEASLRQQGYLPEHETAAVMMHQYRRLKRPLVQQALKRDQVVSPRIIAVCSAVAGEGKSFTSLNLALSLSNERDFTVLLVDGDAARHALTKALGCMGEPGLLDLLDDGGRGLESAIRETSHEGLFFLPSGAWREDAPELLGSQRLGKLFGEIGSRFPNCLILCDTPPVLLTNEARAFLLLAGQVVFVVSAGGTPRQSVVDAVAMIDPDRPIQMVLNKYTGPVDKGYLYYGDYYKPRAAGTERPDDSAS
jgi:protein-tyrosine kinase